MRRTGWLFMLLILAVPMLRECCLPVVTHPSHCQESKQADSESCYSGQAAITESRTALAVSLSIDHGFPASHVWNSDGFGSASPAANKLTFAHTQTIDLYLRTGALLI